MGFSLFLFLSYISKLVGQNQDKPKTKIFDKDGKKLDENYKKVESEFPGSKAYDKNGKKLKPVYIIILSDSLIGEG